MRSWAVTDRRNDHYHMVPKIRLVRPMLAAYENLFSLFSFFLVSSYVGYVPASNDLGIFRFVWRCVEVFVHD